MKLGPYLLGPNDSPENGIYTGDAKELAKLIPDESVDLVFTDPVYQNIEDYRWQAKAAIRVLKDNRACLVFAGIREIDLTIAAIRQGGLSYYWLMGGFIIGRRTPYRWIPLIWAEKGHVIRREVIWDMMLINKGSKLPDADSVNHKWQKPIDWLARYITAFSDEHDIVLDPFTGGGAIPSCCKMLGRKYLAFEIGPDVAEQARQRVRNTQPPLFVPEPEQITLFQDNDNAM